MIDSEKCPNCKSTNTTYDRVEYKESLCKATDIHYCNDCKIEFKGGNLNEITL
jgi:ribosomal protein L37AE/L43A